MTAPANQSNSTAINAALDLEMIEAFAHDYDRLAEIIGVFSPETMHAGNRYSQRD